MNTDVDETPERLFKLLDRENVGTLSRDVVLQALLAGGTASAELLEASPNTVTMTTMNDLMDDVDVYMGIPMYIQRQQASKAAWKEITTSIIGSDKLSYSLARELVSETGRILKTENIRLAPTDIDIALEAADDEARLTNLDIHQETVIPSSVLAAGLCQLNSSAAHPSAVTKSLMSAFERHGRPKQPLESIIEEGDHRLELLLDELELAGDSHYVAETQLVKPIPDEEIEAYEKPSKVIGIPKRTKLIPFMLDDSVTEPIVCEVIKCWYTKTVDGEGTPTVIDEIINNLKKPKKTEGDDIGDPIGLFAEIAFALYARLGPDMPDVGPSTMLVSWLLTLESHDIDKLVGYSDAPDQSTIESSLDQYNRKYTTKRNQSILQDISLTIRGVKEACNIPTDGIIINVNELQGLNQHYAGEMIFIDIQARGQSPQRVEPLLHDSVMKYNSIVFIPLTQKELSIRISIACLSGTEVGYADFKFPPDGDLKLVIKPSEQRLQMLPKGKTLKKVAELTLSAKKTPLDEQTMSDLLEALGGDAQRQWAKAKLQKWVKTIGLTHAIQSNIDIPTHRMSTCAAVTVTQHEIVKKDDFYCWAAPCIVSLDEVSQTPGISYRLEQTRGFDASSLSFYPDEKTVIVPPFATHLVQECKPIDHGLQISATRSQTLSTKGISTESSFNLFRYSCLNDAERADVQLFQAMDRNLIERSRQLMQLVADGELRLQLREERKKTDEHDTQFEPLPDLFIEICNDRLLPLISLLAPSHPIHGISPLAPVTTRATVPHLLSELILLWYDKEGDVLDELIENLSLPDHVDPLSVLCLLSASLSEIHRDQEMSWPELLLLTLLSLEGPDIDRLCLLSEVTTPYASRSDKEKYEAKVGNVRNGSIFSAMFSALGGMADHQLAASLASTTREQKRAALLEPYKAAKSEFQKWIKTFGTLLLTTTPFDRKQELFRCATPAAGETERMLALESNSYKWCFWAAPSRCSTQPSTLSAREGVLKVTCRLRGLTEVIDLTPFQKRHASGDTTPSILSPPLTSFLVGEVSRSGDELNVEFLKRDTLGNSHPALRKWKDAIQTETFKADDRLRHRYSQLVNSKDAEVDRRSRVSAGKYVTLPEKDFVLDSLDDRKEYRYLVRNDLQLGSYCGRESIGLVGNVTCAIETKVSDLRRNMDTLAAELRGTILAPEEASIPPPHVVSVTFKEDETFVLPIDLLTVHPISWMPELPKIINLTILWADLPEKASEPRVRTEVAYSDVSFVTEAPINGDSDEQVITTSSSSGSSSSSIKEVSGESHVIWEEKFEIEVVRSKLAQHPLQLTFSVFTRKEEDEMDEYDYIVKDLRHDSDDTVLGAVSLTIPNYILLETTDNPRRWPLPLIHPSDASPLDDTVTATHTHIPVTHPLQPKGILNVEISMDSEKAESVEEEVTSDMIINKAEPLSWRDGEFAADRICTGCDAGDDECVEAVFVCPQCDEKLCEECWDLEHVHDKDNTTPTAGIIDKQDHRKTLLFHHCDFCYVDSESSKDESLCTPALWICDVCRLFLCKKCWHAEHKNPIRSQHSRTFAYPGGPQGDWDYATTLAQTVTYYEQPFFSEDVTFKSADGALCDSCSMEIALFHWPRMLGGDGLVSQNICEKCLLRQQQEAADDIVEAEAAGVPVPPERPSPKLLMQKCCVCSGTDNRPAVYWCKSCELPLCSTCWKLEHRHPHRRDHEKLSLRPEEVSVGQILFDRVEATAAKMKTVTTVQEPQRKAAVESLETTIWRYNLRVADRQLEREEIAEELRTERQAKKEQRQNQDGSLLTRYEGYITGGGDIGPSKRCTVEEAKQFCLTLPDCKGFTYRVEPGSQRVRVFFKNKWDLAGVGKNKGWESYKREEQPKLSLCRHGALEAYCGECMEAKRRPDKYFNLQPALFNSNNDLSITKNTSPTDLLPAQLADMIWRSSI